MVVDVFTYNGEQDLLDLHLNCLKDKVDRFVGIDFDTSFSGIPKAASDLSRFNSWIESGKLRFYRVTWQVYSQYAELAGSSPNVPVGGPAHWKREFCQKESIKDVLYAEQLDDADTVFVGDVDEIWSPDALELRRHQKLKLKVYTYHLNNRSTEEFWGTIITTYGKIRQECLNHMRSGFPKTEFEYGWHFTSMGGYDEMYRKLTDSYTSDSYSNPSVLGNLATNLSSNKDFLGRDFKFRKDESEWPLYLKENKEAFAHLCTPV